MSLRTLIGPTPHVLLSLSQFKGTLENVQACDIVSSVLKELEISHTSFPVGDGGGGTLLAIKQRLGGEIVSYSTQDPLRREIKARVLYLPTLSNAHSVYVESAECLGYSLIKPEERDVLRSSSAGLGFLLKQIIQDAPSSLKTIYVGLGDTAICDGGLGMLSALGYRLEDRLGHEVWGDGNGLRSIHTIIPPRKSMLFDFHWVVLCDVLSPLTGSNGCVPSFAPQKGARSKELTLLATGMELFAKTCESITHVQFENEPMTGAAGGLAYSLKTFLNAKLVHGASYLLDWLCFDTVLQKHSLLIVGEGRTDHQSFLGKSNQECLKRAAQYGVRSIIISGDIDPYVMALKHQPGLIACYASGSIPNAAEALKIKTLEIFR